MIDKINYFLYQRTSREKLYLFIIALLLGAFAANFTNSFLEIKERPSEDVFLNTQNQKELLRTLNAHLKVFEHSEKDYLNEFYKLANAQKILFEKVQTKLLYEEHFKHFALSAEFETSFHALLFFLKDLQNSPLIFELSNLKLTPKDKLLKASLELHFASLKP